MKSVFSKAKQMYYSGNPKPIGTGISGKEFFEVTDIDSEKVHQVTVEKNEDGTTAICDCSNQSLLRKENLKAGKQNFCSHILTVIYFKVYKEKIR